MKDSEKQLCNYYKLCQSLLVLDQQCPIKISVIGCWRNKKGKHNKPKETTAALLCFLLQALKSSNCF